MKRMIHASCNATSLLLIGFLALAGCGSGDWRTAYGDVIDPAVSKTWRVSSIQVEVPETLSVSEENSYAPEADIVWREDPPGNRYEQVKAIMTKAAEVGTQDLRGSHPVRLVIQVSEFHALSQKTRATLEHTGVHNITFVAQVIDDRTGAELSPPDTIRADLVALSGAEAIIAVSQGQTQKVRIISHVSKVIAGWLGQGPDVRGSFTRRGR